MQDTSASPDTPVIAPAGDLDLTTSRDLASRLGEVAGTPGDAVLDLSAIGFMDSVGLAVVLKAVGRFRRQDKQLVLVVPPEGDVARLIELAGFRDRLPTFPSRDDALAHAGRSR